MATKNIPYNGKFRNELPVKLLQGRFIYDPETGYLHHRRTNRRAGFITTLGYRYVSVNGIRFLEHRIIWAVKTGAWPVKNVDHKNSIKTDNRWENLRQANHSENGCNQKKSLKNTSGFKGVTFHKQRGRWRAQISIVGKYYSLGMYDTVEEAHAAYCCAALRLHREFARFK